MSRQHAADPHLWPGDPANAARGGTSTGGPGAHTRAREVKPGRARADEPRVSPRSRRRAAAVVAGLLLCVVAPAGSARAESAEEARAAARSAAERVAALQPGVDRALKAYELALADLASGVSRSIVADQEADAAAVVDAARRGQASDRVRALYMTGSAAALYASVLDAGSAAEAMQRVAYVQRLVAVGSAAATAGSADTARLRGRAGVLESRADAGTATAAKVQRRYETVLARLDEAAAEVAALSERARGLEEAQALLARIADLNAAVAATGAQRVETARASAAIPPLYKRLYVQAARTCPGMSWSLLAAIGQVESGHGANPGTSYAGAQGPMQFLPSTFQAYAVDGDKDGDKDIRDPADSVFSAANYLCRNGAGRGPDALARAIWHYNQADWYVQLVLKLAGQYAERDGGGNGGNAGNDGADPDGR